MKMFSIPLFSQKYGVLITRNMTFLFYLSQINQKSKRLGALKVMWNFGNNKGADQPAHPSSLISAFVIRLLESFIYLDML